MKNNRETTIRNYVILIGSTFSVMAGATIAPALPEMKAYFSDIPNIEFLVKLMLAIPPLFIALFSPLAGICLDKFGRKAVLFFSVLLFGIAGTSGFYLDDLIILIISRAIVGISVAGILTGYIALIGDYFKDSELNKFMGIQAAVMSFSGVLFLIISGRLADISWNYPFLIFIFAFIILPFLYKFIKEPDVYKETVPKNLKIKLNSNMLLINLLAVFGMLLFLMIPTQLPFLMNEIQTVNNSTIGYFMAIWILASAATSLFYKKIKSNFNFNIIFAVSLIIWTSGFFIIYFFQELSYTIIGLILAGIGNGLYFPNLKVNLLVISDINVRGKMTGLLAMSLYIGQFISPIVMQPIIEQTSIFSIFLYFGILMLLVSIAFIYFGALRKEVGYRF